jgi:hypothetical protein
MDWPDHLADLVVRERVARLHAECARARRVAAARGTARWRVVLGTALVTLGERLRAGAGAPRLSSAPPG